MSLRRWEVLAAIINDDKLETFVEIGAKEGRTTAYILRHCPHVRVIAIDPWVAQPEQKDKKGGETYEDWNFDTIEQMFKKNVEGHEDRLDFRKDYSLNVAETIPERSIDIVFIDGAHDYDSVVSDISVWLPKVKPGGFIAGHDFQHRFPSVMRAVADCFNLMQVQVAPDSVWWTRV